MGLIIGGVLLVAAPFVAYAVVRGNQIEDVCKRHGMDAIGGGHSPFLCVEKDTGRVYSWRYLK